MHDTNLEERLRSVLRQEGDGLPFTITKDELERRLALRRRARNGQRLSLLAAGVAVVAIGAIFAFGNGWLRGTNVATVPSPSPAPATTPAPSASADPLAGLPILVQDPESVDFNSTESLGDPANTDPVLGSVGLEGVRMEAREAGIKVVCRGPDAAILTWGTERDRTSVASQTIPCDGAEHSFRYDVSARQPMLGYVLDLQVTPRTGYRVLVESFGSTNDPVPVALPSFATPEGTVVTDVAITQGAPASGPPAPMRAGSVPPRGAYRVALVCLGQGTARWSIGAEGELDFVAADDVKCDGAAIGFEPTGGMPANETTVWVTTDPANVWHIIITDPFGAPASSRHDSSCRLGRTSKAPAPASPSASAMARAETRAPPPGRHSTVPPKSTSRWAPTSPWPSRTGGESRPRGSPPARASRRGPTTSG